MTSFPNMPEFNHESGTASNVTVESLLRWIADIHGQENTSHLSEQTQQEITILADMAFTGASTVRPD
jgi:hypothetical protein